MKNNERSDKWKEILIEHTYMLTLLANIKNLITEEQYKKLKNEIEEEFLKKREKYCPLDVEEIISNKNLVCV